MAVAKEPKELTRILVQHTKHTEDPASSFGA